MYTDSTGYIIGLLAAYAVAALIGAAIAGSIQIATNVAFGEEWNNDLAGAMLGGALAGALTVAGAGSLVVGLSVGLITASGNQIQQHGLNFKQWNGGEFLADAVITGVFAGLGSSYGMKKIGFSAKQVGSWAVPKVSNLIGSRYLGHITKAIAYSVVPAVFTNSLIGLKGDTEEHHPYQNNEFYLFD